MPADSTSWRQVFKGFYQQKPVPNRPNVDYAIPITDIPVDLTAQLLVIHTYSTNFKATWRWAGYLHLTERLSPAFDAATLKRISLPLNDTIKVEVKPSASSYSLRLDLKYWIINIGIEVWEYYGSNVSTYIESSLSELKAISNRIEEKVTDISDYGRL